MRPAPALRASPATIAGTLTLSAAAPVVTGGQTEGTLTLRDYQATNLQLRDYTAAELELRSFILGPEPVITLRDFTAMTLILSDQPAAELELTNHTG